jgi:eukaryotic-like serine/threonine-protein kinase
VAKPAASSPSSPSSHLTLRVVVLVVLVALLAAGVVAGWAEWRIRTAAPASGAGELDSAVRAQSRADAQRLDELALVAGRLARRADLPLGAGNGGAGGEDGAAASLRALIGSLEDVLDEHQVELIVLRGGGEMALRVGAPADAAREMAVSAVMEQALDEGRASGVWSFGERLYRVAAEQVEADGETLGALAVADLVGRATVIEARAVSRAEALYVLAPAERGDGGEGATVVASTLDQAAGETLVAALSDAGVLADVLGGTERRDPVDVTLGGTSYRALAVPLPAGTGGASAARVALIETGAGHRQLRMVQAAALAGGLGALLLGLLGAPLVTRGSGSGSKEVAEAARAARAGDLAGAARHAVPAPLALYFQETAEKRALEAVVASLGRTEGVPGGGSESGGHPEGQPARSKGAVLAVEMPGYARTLSDQDPREVSERLGRDVVRLRRAVTARGGRLEATLGHRALAVFQGERAGARAVGAAAEAMKVLATPENAFDEPTPPAAAVATGTFVAGGPEGARTVSGLPVQQTESLLREASSGDLIVARQAFRELEGELSAGGVEVAAQRGLLTSQPVYLLDAGKAARAAAALGSAEGASAADLSGLAAGSVLGDRFTLVERRSASPAQAPVWLRYLARDGELDAFVTLRALRPGTVVDLAAFEAFDGPLQQVQRAVDPSVERVIAAGESDGVTFLAAERVEGPTLERLLAGLLAERRPLGAAAALRVARTLAAGLAAVHAAGIPHGALRPASVTLDPRGHARLTGLGLALVLPSYGIDPAVDRALGPARYRAPELLAGGEASPAADVYAAGVLLTELFSGRISEEGAPPEPPDATELPDGLAPVLVRCLDRDPTARYPDGAALAEALGPVRAELLT